MVFGKDFSRGGALGDFSNIFLGGGPKVVKYHFSHSKLRKFLFMEIFKFQGGKAPLPPVPTPMLWSIPTYEMLEGVGGCEEPGSFRLQTSQGRSYTYIVKGIVYNS